MMKKFKEKKELCDPDFEGLKEELWKTCHVRAVRAVGHGVFINFDWYKTSDAIQIIKLMLVAARNAIFLSESEGCDFD